ncbi:ABC1 family protein [Hypoxylon trugodes]|uniref:ABC1 family protein n=1 Tax=Hypoxylon trugodes TaxID=326681 RepID=UPI0021A0FB66|nr:ABC1 family protein [Hypoxylon trugodes]KAI1387340.1 ABC1 family protein [Hypoxylon trugodes]
MRPVIFFGRFCIRRSSPRSTKSATNLGRWHSTFRSQFLGQSPWRNPRLKTRLLGASANIALGTVAFVSLSEKDNEDTEQTAEGRMLKVSREELRKKVSEDEEGIYRLGHKLVLLFDFYFWEPLCTGVRFVELVFIFIPVIFAVPAVWIGSRQPDRDHERSGTLWWYHFLVKSMERAGPAFIKLGQWAASRTDIFPTEMCDIMSKLHSHAPAHSLEATMRIVEKAFDGRRFQEIFEEFEETPLGVGAIAQVYKAKLKPDLAAPGDVDVLESRSNLRRNVRRKVDTVLKSMPKRVPSSYVAVKVLHPRVERTVRRDLRIMVFFASVLNIIPTIEWLSLPDEVTQFGEMMKLQLDLRIEAANLAKFRRNFKDRTTAWFPFPYLEFTTREVLIEEFAQGIPLADFLENGGGVFQRDISQEGLDAFLRMLLIDNFVHADLHPGNIMVRFYQAYQPDLSLRNSSNGQKPHPKDQADVTEQVLARLRPFRKRKDPAAWEAELKKIDQEGFRPQLIFIDTGLVTELNATNRQNFLDLFRAVAEFDGYKAGHLMCERCRQPDAVIDKEVFALKMQHLVLNVKSSTLALGNVKIGDILQRVLDMVRQHHVRLEGDFVNVVISILLLEGIGRSLDPNVDLLSSSLPILRQLGAQSGAEMMKGGDFSMFFVWAGLEARRFMKASIEDVERCVKYDLLSPNV